MKWKEFLEKFAERPLFHSSLLNIFPEDVGQIRVQLSRWVKAGKIVRIRREWYLVKKPWRAKEVPLTYIAAQIVQPSYISLEWALQHHGAIPDVVENTTSITTNRPRCIRALGRLFIYQHVQPVLLTGFTEDIIDGWPVPMASVEKALFDMIYLHIQKRRFSQNWLSELRLQNLDEFDIGKFLSFAPKSAKRGLSAAIQSAAEFIKEARR